MKFMITFKHTAGEWEKLTPEDRERHGAWLRELRDALESEKGSRLVFFSPPADAKTVRMHADRRVEVTDGPDPRPEEHAGGYYIVEVESEEEAVEWAKKGRFMVGSNEVRRIFDSVP